jgi:acyl transferase domain-containing protein/NAD(P)H-dependent flavin oxidoreductase YrpB (nitropropane dioxygenase family)
MNKCFENGAAFGAGFFASGWPFAEIYPGNASWIVRDERRFRTLIITPLERSDVALARVAHRHGVAAAIDIGRDLVRLPSLLASLGAVEPAAFGLRIPDGVDIPADCVFPEAVGFLILAGSGDSLPATWRRVPVLSQVCSVAQAERALESGVAGLIAKGQESGGPVGDESSFVLLQRIVALAEERALPEQMPVRVWSQGGIGLATAAGAFAGGAFGIVLDSLISAYPESGLPAELKARILAMDGSEVQSVAGYQVYARSQQEIAALTGLSRDEVRKALATGELLPIGQDTALARIALAECPTLESLLHTLRMRIAGQLRQAQTLAVLDEGNPLARALGTRYPVVQGPMTRVSDNAEFAAAVAEGGGMPVLALSLMREEPSRALLEATRDRVGDHPWGVGVLAFAPPEIIEPQLDLVRAFKPSLLILAGGRPAQARPFVDAGIPTYLHVPSPGLLDLYLKEGATHFIFEGRECGGHVGPRYSFVLWEQALSRLEQVERPEDLHILFAGGIHDARSSAMVGVIAARLAAKGAKIGVLMGTAYIATEEAVSCGAVLDGFQRKALTGDRTVLVETAPGHAVRCLPSGFMALFAREEARLSAEGVDRHEAWRALEALTVGRLRIATKGVDYVDGRLAPVDPARQEAEGMYMIGQAIAMKRAVTRVADLHAEVTHGATRHLADLKAPALEPAANAGPIAIVGMACIFPGSPDLESYWSNILEGRDLVGEVPPGRWNVGQYFKEGAAAPGKTASRWGGFIRDTPFDPLKYGIPPQSLAAIEPVQLLSLEVASRALEDAGYGQRWFDREKTAVIFGAESGMELAGQYSFRNLYPQYCGDLPPALADVLPELTEDSFPGILVNVISGRIANRLGLGGVNYAVDSACASSLTAIELAVKELRAGSSDLVLAGGADFHNGISDFLMFSSAGALSPTGRCRSFDARADGIALGEGVGVVVLKRLEDAERDGDRIYAVLDGVAGSSDGKGLGMTAPRKEGQKRALERAYWQAGVLPGDVALVEAHGTGTVVGDRTELSSLTEVYTVGGAVPGQAVLGSVKSQIGHTKCAAGIAGLIKVAKALHHQVLPPTGQVEAPNPAYRAETSPFQINRRPTPWLPRGRSSRAAVSAFGFGGTNFHAVLSAYPAHRSAVGSREFPAEAFFIRGRDAAAADSVLRNMARFIAGSDAPFTLRDLAAAAWAAGSGPVQIAFAAGDAAGLAAKIQAALGREQDSRIVYRPTAPEGKLACLFSGQGSQYPGMLRDLFVAFPLLQGIQGAAAYVPLIFPPSEYGTDAEATARRRLTDTRNAQPALGLVELAAFRWLAALGLRPDMAAGHSYGELAALAAAGAFDAETLLTLSRARADAILDAVGSDPGAMAAVRLDAASLAPHLAGFPGVVMANQNSPIQTVISGPTEAVRAACSHLETEGIGARPIETACAFHSPLMAGAEAKYAAVLARHAVGPLEWPVYSNLTTEPHTAEPEAIRAALARHIVSPVRFAAEIERMYADGARVFFEIGPKRVLTGLVGRILKGRPHTAIALDGEDAGLAGLFEAITKLAVHIPDFDAAPLYAGRTTPLDLDAPRRLSATTWMVDGGRARALRGTPPAHAAKPVLAPVIDGRAPAAINATDEALVGYLSNMREMIQAQRDVLVSYFGAAPAETPRAPIRPLPTLPAPMPVLEANPTKSAAIPDLQAMLLGIVSDRTGYPAEMLDLDLDLEADLSIDSIKRVEILGELAQRLPAQAGGLTEGLTRRKTLRGILDGLRAAEAEAPTAGPVAAPAVRIQELLLDIVSQCTGYPAEVLEMTLDLEADLSIDSIKRGEIVGQLAAHLAERGEPVSGVQIEALARLKTLGAMIGCLGGGGTAPLESVMVPEVAPVPAAPTRSKALVNPHDEFALERYVLRAVPVAPARPAAVDLRGQHFLITDDGLGLAPLLAVRLGEHGATAKVIAFPDHPVGADPAILDVGPADGLIHLGSLRPEATLCDVKRLFGIMREALAKNARHVLVASGLGGDFGVAGAATGLHRGFGLAGLVKTVASEFPSVRAHTVDLDPTEPAKMLADHLQAELLAEDPLPEVAYKRGQRFTRELVLSSAEGEMVDGLDLARESIVLLTGGARGITSLLAVALARRHRCHIELVGRSPLPEGEEGPLTSGIEDPRVLRRVLMESGGLRKPAEVERAVQRLKADRETRRTLARIRDAGSSVTYTPLDVRDGPAFAAFIDSLYQRHGRIDGVVHGAGVIEDRLVRDKTDESFGRVFDTKVQGALALREGIRNDVKFVVFFSSVASVFGNRGQADYAAANDVLDRLAYRWQSQIPGRVLSLNWGPWAGTGMVSDTLKSEYSRKGIGLIPQEAGVDALLQELGARRGDSQVVLMCGKPGSFAGPRARA